MKKKIVSLFLFFIFLLNCNHFLFGQCFKSGEFTAKGLFTSTTTNQFIDSIVNKEILKLEHFFNINVDFLFLLESQGKNAFFTPNCNSNCDGSVILGLNMLEEEILSKNGLETIKAILAHEFAHAVQHSFGWLEPGKNPELHADFIAGFYIGKTYNYNKTELDKLYSTFLELGDNNFFSPQHHGTAGERLCAFYEGHYVAKNLTISTNDVISLAYSYVTEYSPCGIQTAIRNYSIYQNDLKNNNFGTLLIKCKTSSPLIVEVTDYNGQKIKYIVKKKMLIDKLAVNIDYPVRIIESGSNRVRWTDIIKPSTNGPTTIIIGNGNNFKISWSYPSR